MRLREAVGLDHVGVLVHPLHHRGGWHGGGETMEAPAAMGMEPDKRTEYMAARLGVGRSTCSSPQELEAPPPHTTREQCEGKCHQKQQPGPCWVVPRQNVNSGGQASLLLAETWLSGATGD